MNWFLSELQQHKDALDIIIRIIVATLGLLGIWLLNRRTTATERQVAISELALLNDQYIKSIEQLGSGKIELILGAIYGLEKVALTSEKFYRQVIEVLTAYIRVHAAPLNEEDVATHKPRADIQAILTVLGRVKNEGQIIFDLRDSYLAKYKFEGDFSEAIFYNANLSETACFNVNFTGANFIDSNFSKAMLHDANFSKANCSRVNFSKANCTRTNFCEARCLRANFSEASCFEANFSDAIHLDKSFGLENLNDQTS